MAAANRFKGKSGSTLDILAPEGLKVSRLIVVGAGKLSALKDKDFLKLGGVDRRQTARRQRGRDGRRGIARGRDEAGSGRRDRLGHPAARL